MNKVVFISGDVSDGSPNDVKMTELIGSDWKIKTGAEQPQLTNCSPGYDHETYWPTVVKRMQDMEAVTASSSDSVPVTSDSKDI